MTQTNGPITRRRMLRLGGLTAAGAAAATVAAATPATAGVDGDVVLGSNANVATTPTGIAVTGTTAGYGLGVVDNGLGSLGGDKPSLLAHASNQNFREAILALAQGVAVGITARSDENTAIIAVSTRGPSAVHAICDHGDGVLGVTLDGNGVRGSAYGGGSGVHGYAGGAGGGSGVWGDGNASTTGVLGTSVIGTGVAGQNTGTSGYAMIAQALHEANATGALSAESFGTGPAVRAKGWNPGATNPTIVATSACPRPAIQTAGRAVPAGGAVATGGNGPALEVVGVASFTRSGAANIAATKTSVVVNVPGGLSATSQVLAVLQSNAANRWVRAAVANPATGKATIFLNGAAPAGGVKVAWFVFG